MLCQLWCKSVVNLGSLEGLRTVCCTSLLRTLLRVSRDYSKLPSGTVLKLYTSIYVWIKFVYTYLHTHTHTRTYTYIHIAVWSIDIHYATKNLWQLREHSLDICILLTLDANVSSKNLMSQETSHASRGSSRTAS